MTNVSEGYLAGCRVVDLTDHRGLLAGHLLAHLGAEVIQVEPPTGSPARSQPPLRGSRSFYWDAYAAGKRSVTCDLDSEGGRALFLRLLATADVLIESSDVGVLASKRLGYEDVKAMNPRLVYVSITPFGSYGPKARYADSDLVLWAAGGAMLPCRDGPGSPLRMSVPQAYLHACADAAVGALIALSARRSSGRGQHVDVSVQQSVAQATLSSVLAAAVGHEDFDIMQAAGQGASKGKKPLDLSGSGALTRRSKWQAADGLVEFHLGIGTASGSSSNALFAWLRDAGELEQRFMDWDWITLPTRLQSGEISDEDMEEARALVARFFAKRSKQEIEQEAGRRKIMLAAIMTTKDLLASEHFAARGYFDTLQGSQGVYTTPGRFAITTNDGLVRATPAPSLGQDNDEVWRELALVADEPTRVQQKRSSNDGGAQPLAGLKVADFAWVVAGPMIGRVLADFGATVVRVESSKRVDTARIMGPFRNGKRDVQRSALFENCNAGKLGLALDLNDERSQQVARDLIAWADVVVESFAPGQMARWGLDYEQLARKHPDLIMVSTSLMGQRGPRSAFAGYGNIGAAVAGFQAVVGRPGALPISPHGPYTDYVGPRFALATLLGALERRARTGQGCHIDAAQTEAGMKFLAAEIVQASVTGEVVQLAGNHDPQYAPHNAFRASGEDRWVAIAARSDAQWRKLAHLIGGEQLASDARFTTLQQRKAHEEEIERLVTEWTAARDALAIEVELQAAGIPAHVVASSADFCADAQLQARKHLVHLAHPHGGESVVETSRFELSDTPANIERSAPTYGRDNEYVLRELLGYTQEQIAQLSTAGVLQ